MIIVRESNAGAILSGDEDLRETRNLISTGSTRGSRVYRVRDYRDRMNAVEDAGIDLWRTCLTPNVQRLSVEVILRIESYTEVDRLVGTLQFSKFNRITGRG